MKPNDLRLRERSSLNKWALLPAQKRVMARQKAERRKRKRARKNHRLRNNSITLQYRGPEVIRGRVAYNRVQLQQLCDLHRVQSCSFEQLISRNPERKAIIERAINTHTPDLTIIFSGNIERHRVTIILRFINQFQSWRFG